MEPASINVQVLEATAVVACAPVVVVSAWLLRRHRQPFFAEWVRAYAGIWVVLLFDYANLRTGRDGLMLASALALFVVSLYSLRTIDRIRSRPLTTVRSVVLGAAPLFGLELAGFISLRTLVVVSVVFIAVVTTLLGVAMLKAARRENAASGWVAAPFFLKSAWVFAYPYLGRHDLAPVGYWVDGLLHVATGLGMLVFVLERSVIQMALVRDGTPGHAFLTIDGVGRLVEWNEGAEQLFGLKSAAMVGQRLTVLEPREGDVDDPPTDAWLQAMVRAEAGDIEVWLRRGDGRDIWCRTSSVKVSGGIGQSQAIVMVHDITERRSAEARMRFLMTAVEQTPEGIALADAEGRIQYANSGFAQLMGFSVEQLRGRPLQDAGRAPGMAVPGDPLFDAVKDRRPWLGRITGRRTALGPAVDEAAVMPIRGDASLVTGFLLRLRDVTAEVTMRERLRHAQKLEAIGRLAAGVAHDFGNLMSIVAAQNNALTTPNLDDATLAEARRANDRAVERAEMLIRQLLVYSRSNAGQPRVVDVNAELRDVARMLRRVVGEEVELSLRPQAGRPSVRIDPGQLEQVVVNLVVNARDALQGRGRILLATADDRGEEPWMELTVTDEGPGIAPEKLKRIFDPFFTTKATGTGLGLSIVSEIIEEAGGTITAESVVGRGTTFRIRLPVSAEAVHETPNPPPGPHPGLRGTVLVVEDEEDLLTAMQANLERSGFVVLTAGSPSQALRVARSHPTRIDILLTDMAMPGGSGRALAQQLRHIRPDLRVLFMSGYSDEFAVVEGRSGLGEFIAKPFVFETLVGRIEALLADAEASTPPGPTAAAAAL
ncbi:MAG: hypothetical protein RL199_425 [Pseudomonadota bacterium]|jgi:PAS domain S-box-containing protein